MLLLFCFGFFCFVFVFLTEWQGEAAATMADSVTRCEFARCVCLVMHGVYGCVIVSLV